MIERLKVLDANKKAGNKNYYMTMTCLNCGSRGVEGFTHGERCGGMHECPHCGCFTYVATRT